MTASSLAELVAARADDPGIRLLTETTATLRADAGFFGRDDDAAAADFLRAETPAALETAAFQDVMARICEGEERDTAAETAGKHDPRRAEISRLPSPVREAALKALDTGRWSFGGLGIRRLPLAVGSRAHVELMRIEPGFGAADHDHAAEELTLILTGAYNDGHAYYGPGDLTVAEPGFNHAPVAEPGEICYVLAVTYGPPRFTGMFGVLQRLLGFPWTREAAPN